MNLQTKLIPIVSLLLLNSVGSVSVVAQTGLSAISNNSGGVLSPEQAAYDVKSYDLDLRFNIEEHSIKGVLTVTARIVSSIDRFVLDLDKPLTVDSVSLIDGRKQTPLTFERQAGKILIAFPKPEEQGKTVTVRVAYSGKPKVAVRPPWDGGVIWSKTSDGQPWIAVACETEGADLWFPVKDHPSDEPETVSLHYTVPDNLVAAGNGKLRSIVKHADGTQTFNWFVSQPINNYCITFAIAPYKRLKIRFNQSQE